MLHPGTPENHKIAWPVRGPGFPAVETRRCAGCQEEKTIEGVWFLVNQAEGASGGGDGSDFLCEGCFNDRAGGLRGAQVQRRDGRRRGSPAG